MNDFLRALALASFTPIPTAYLWIAAGVALVLGGIALIYVLVRRKGSGGSGNLPLIIGGIICLGVLALGIYLVSVGIHYSTELNPGFERIPFAAVQH